MTISQIKFKQSQKGAVTGKRLLPQLFLILLLDFQKLV